MSRLSPSCLTSLSIPFHHLRPMRHYPHLWISARGLGLSGTSTHLTRQLSGTHYEPLRHPTAPGLSLTGLRLIIPDHALGLPVLRALSLCTCRRHYPGAADGRTRRSNSPIRASLPRNHYRVGLHIVLFEDCSAFTHVAACTLARSPNRDRYPKASDTSSPPCLLRSLPAGAVAGRGLHPLETRRLVTAHVVSRPLVDHSQFGLYVGGLVRVIRRRTRTEGFAQIGPI